ncbi:hypothetical protein ABT090_20880 [Streptomyces asoensis]|uniref:hypothetical protein n=1 Tax=Streptomyces asoensis TaxID=249586 RepID=UPI0033182084
MKPDETLPDTHARDITIYPVGLLAHWQHYVHNPDRQAARHRLRLDLGYPIRQARARNWRAVKNYFNGYLAEHAHFGTRCGTGWTRGRAYRDLARHLHRDPRTPA